MIVRWYEMITAEWVRRLKSASKNQPNNKSYLMETYSQTLYYNNRLLCDDNESIVSETMSFNYNIERMESRSTRQDQVCVIDSPFKNK